jgi:hypothetical protein
VGLERELVATVNTFDEGIVIDGEDFVPAFVDDILPVDASYIEFFPIVEFQAIRIGEEGVATGAVLDFDSEAVGLHAVL